MSQLAKEIDSDTSIDGTEVKIHPRVAARWAEAKAQAERENANAEHASSEPDPEAGDILDRLTGKTARGSEGEPLSLAGPTWVSQGLDPEHQREFGLSDVLKALNYR